MRVFVSHSRKDNSFINQHIKPALSRHFKKIDIFDEDTTRGGITPYPRLVEESIENCDLFIVIVSENSNNIRITDQVNNEIIIAKENKKPVLPISIDNAPYNDLKIHLATLQPIKLRSGLNTDEIENQNIEFREDLNNTIKTINHIDTNTESNNEISDQIIKSPASSPPPKTHFYNNQKLLFIILFCLTAFIISFLVYQGYPEPEDISIDQIPRFDSFGGDMEMDIISGTVNIRDIEKHRIVVYAKTNFWYVQPYDTDNLHRIESSGSWQIHTHLGKEYCVLLVKNNFKPISITQQFPGDLPGVICYKSVP